ncbi:hypothetical protein HZB02_06555 [Candidatus Woesearchaeota archaeon]|nr:hypothetical protein [Candidatus Woesearchaeota archaeon]
MEYRRCMGVCSLAVVLSLLIVALLAAGCQPTRKANPNTTGYGEKYDDDVEKSLQDLEKTLSNDTSNETADSNRTLLNDTVSPLPTKNTSAVSVTPPPAATPVVPDLTGVELTETERKMPLVVVNEGELVKVSLTATDPDGDQLTYTYSNPLNSKGQWQTTFGDAGKYTVQIKASDGKSESSLNVLVVVKAVNREPKILGLTDLSVFEGDVIKLTPTVIDPDHDNVTITYEGFMDSNTKQTTYTDAGVYKVTIKASDGKATVQQTITITVLNKNRPPELSNLPAVLTITEGDLVKLQPQVFDPDNDPVTVSFLSNLLNQNGEWQTKRGDAGTYTIKVKASDGQLVDSKDVEIIVKILNNAPVIQSMADVVVKEGETVHLNPIVSDKDGDTVTVSYSGWMTAADKQTDYDSAGTYTVTVTATDGKDTVSQNVKVTVENVNRPPVFTP